MIVSVLSCTSTQQGLSEDSNQLRLNCLKKKIAVDCAQYAYNIEATNPSLAAQFNQRACVLGEESACMTNKQTSKSSIEHNMELLQSSAEDMYACYYEAAGVMKREEVSNGNNETKSIHINVKLKSSGKVASITIERNQIENAAANCIRRMINLIEFDPGPRIQNLDYKLTVPKAYL